MNSLGIFIFKHHGALHIAASWFPIHCTIALDGRWLLRDGHNLPVRMDFALYRLRQQTVFVIGRLAFRIDRKAPFTP